MRTQKVLFMAALATAGFASAVAQVYSVNVVGYVNTTLKPGFNLVANPLDDKAGNKVSSVLAGVPDGSTVYTYSGSYTINTLDGEWGNPDAALAPGTGFFIRVPGAANVTVTFVGEVMQGTLTVPLSQGFNLVASKVPQAGKISTDLKLPVADGDTVYRYTNPTGYTIYTYEGEWDPSEPEVAVGEAVWVRKLAAGTWTRDFTVPQN